MTFGIYFQTEHAMLWHVRYALETWPSDGAGPPYAHIPAGAACVLACQAALEAIVNRLLDTKNKLQANERLSFRRKIELVAQLGGVQIDWAVEPWTEISRLVRLRNWLTHNKQSYIGLIGAYGEWVADGTHKVPELNPEEELLKDSVYRFYNAVRESGTVLSTGLGLSSHYEYLRTERYEPIEVG